MPIHPDLAYLTEGYTPVAQMSIKLAHELGFIYNANYAIVNSWGDETSAGLPYFADVTHSEESGYQFMNYAGSKLLTVSPDFQVLVYENPPRYNLSPDEQIDMLEELSAQFPEDSLIRRFISYHMIQWLQHNKDNPDIYHQLVHMKNVANRLEDNIIRLNHLFNDPFPY